MKISENLSKAAKDFDTTMQSYDSSKSLQVQTNIKIELEQNLVELIKALFSQLSVKDLDIVWNHIKSTYPTIKAATRMI
jgi:hypothetical protein